MAHEKLLILESTWATNEEDYISDSRSTARIYLSFESLLSLHNTPVIAIHRPLLASRYLRDIEQFVCLPSNREGLNIIILSAHGSFSATRKGHRFINRRRLHAIDGVLKISKDIHLLKGKLSRTIFVLDACNVGERLSAFRTAAGALGAIGFSKEVDWIDSATFILACLLTLQAEDVFANQATKSEAAASVLKQMIKGPYKSLAKELGLEYSFA